MSHCFGLNSDIFNPLFDSVEDIQRELTRSFREKKFVPQGPAIFSEVVEFARAFAHFCRKQDSRYYVVLVIMTNNELSDIEAFKEELRLSCEYPLSVIICRVVPNKKMPSTYGTMGTLHTEPALERRKTEVGKSDAEKHTKSPKKESAQADPVQVYKKISEELKSEGRDILHAFCVGEKKKLGLTNTARKVFQKLPKQFVEYMEKKGKKPKLNEEGRGSNGRIKELKKELINKMNNRKKNLDKDKSVINRFLLDQRSNFRKRALGIGFDPSILGRILETTPGRPVQSDSDSDDPKAQSERSFRQTASRLSVAEDKRTPGEVGLAAKDLNLLSELVGYLYNLKSIREKEPIMLGQLEKREGAEEAEAPNWAKGVGPKEEIVFTREDNDNINSKWKQRQKDLYTRTQKFLRKLEQREINFQKENFPEALFQKLEEGFFKLEEGKSEERKDDAIDQDDRAEAINKGVRAQVKEYFVECSEDSDEDSEEIYNSEDEVYIRLDTVKERTATEVESKRSLPDSGILEQKVGESWHESAKVSSEGEADKSRTCPMWFRTRSSRKS